MVEPAPKAQAVLAAAYASLLITAAAQAAPDCLALKNQRDQLARQAMNAEIALMHSIRQRLCPRVEERAAQLNALEHETATPEPLNYENYIRCREKAEIQLQRSRPFLYRNLREFTFDTPEGSRLARASDEAQKLLDRSCTMQGD
jgi:hypothetical protein